MRFRISFLCTFSCTLVLVACSVNAAEWNTPTTPEVHLSPGPGSATGNLLARAAAANRDLFASLQSFICSELIERYRVRLGSENARHLDTVSVQVSLENGLEHCSNIRREDHPIKDLASLDGAWSEGEFGTLLQQTEQLLRTQPVVIDGTAELNGAPAVMLHFDIPATDSPWDLAVGGQHYFIPFRTRVWLSEASGDILKIARASTKIPSALRISQIDWGVTLSPVDLNGKQWLLPNNGEYQVIYRDSVRREWNILTFSGYHRYGAEVKLHFD